MPGPERGQGGGGDQVGAGLPVDEQFGVAGQPVDCFTWNFKGFREIHRSTDGRGGTIARHLPSPFAQALLAATPFFR